MWILTPSSRSALRTLRAYSWVFYCLIQGRAGVWPHNAGYCVLTLWTSPSIPTGQLTRPLSCPRAVTWVTSLNLALPCSPALYSEQVATQC